MQRCANAASPKSRHSNVVGVCGMALFATALLLTASVASAQEYYGGWTEAQRADACTDGVSFANGGCIVPDGGQPQTPPTTNTFFVYCATANGEAYMSCTALGYSTDQDEWTPTACPRTLCKDDTHSECVTDCRKATPPSPPPPSPSPPPPPSPSPPPPSPSLPSLPPPPFTPLPSGSCGVGCVGGIIGGSFVSILVFASWMCGYLAPRFPSPLSTSGPIKVVPNA